MSEFLELREKHALRNAGSTFTMQCPCHDDKTASLSVKDKGDGSALVNCFAGCDWKGIRDKLGLGRTAKRPATAPSSPAKALKAQYEYRDSGNRILAVKRRYAPKTFDWISADESGVMRPGLGAAGQSALPLYRLPELLAGVSSGARVYVAEGEKDADNLAALGLVSTTNPEGAGLAGWPANRWDALHGADVVILPDNDETGRKHGQRIAAALSGIAASVRVLDLPNLPPKGDVSDWLANGGTRTQLEALADAAPLFGETPDARPASDMAREVLSTIRRFVVLGEHELVACTLWLLHTHALEASDVFSPYLAVSSPTRAAGKTTLLDVLGSLAANPWKTDSASPAAIYRRVDVGRGNGKQTGRPPTVFLDELDTIFSNGVRSERNEALRGVLNSGFRRDGRFTICEGDLHEPRDYATWSAKCLAGIGKALPDTVADRSIPIALSRATREELESVQTARHRALAALAPLRDEIAAWAENAVTRLSSREEPSIDLGARQSDIWGPLLAIADDIGDGWPDRAREAARALHADTRDATDGRDAGVALLADLRAVFADDRSDFVTSARLSELLALMEDRPWPEFNGGKPITKRGVARLLDPYGIRPVVGRLHGDAKAHRGYRLADCQNAFVRYLPDTAQSVALRNEPIPMAVSPSVEGQYSTQPATVPPYVSEPTDPATLLRTHTLPPALNAPSWAPDPEGSEPLPF